MKVKGVKEQACESLNELFKDYPDLQSIYLQGSITFADTEADYDPDTSDIDGVAIAPDGVPLEVEDELRAELDRISDYDTGIRLLYQSDLNDGTTRSRLATFVDPQALLYAFPDWEHVAGRNFRAEEFDLYPVQHDDVIKTHLDAITKPEQNHDGDWRDARAVSEKNFKYYLNNLSRLIDAIQNKRNDVRRPFSYSGLGDAAEGFEQSVVDAILAIRHVRKDRGREQAYELFQAKADIFQNYVAALVDGRDVTSTNIRTEKTPSKIEKDEIVGA